MATKKWDKFPQTVYVAWEDTTDGPYLQADERFEGYSVVNEARPVAVYQLVEVKRLTTKPTLE